MAHLDTAFKLGALSAVDDFTAWLQNDDGNPTEYPKRRGAILKTANTPMQPNPGTSMGPTGATGNMALASGAGALNRTGGTGGGVAGAAPSAPASTGSGGGGGRVSMAAFIMGGGGKNQSANCRETGVCNPGAPPKPPPKKPTAQIGSGGMVATAADHAVEQVMRKLGKSMSRRPLGREGTKFEALKKKLRKQKSKKR